jgi:hypothetical protein
MSIKYFKAGGGGASYKGLGTFELTTVVINEYNFYELYIRLYRLDDGSSKHF